jgi:branched-chain amino acid transport system permease protein
MSRARFFGFGLLAIVLIILPWLINTYVLQVFILTITYSMLGLAFALSLKVGLPRFDIAAWWGVGAYTTAMLMLKTNMSFWLTLPIAGITAVILGLILFYIIIPKGMMVFLLAGMVLTLAAQQIFASVPFFGGWGGTNLIPIPSLVIFSLTNKIVLYYLGIVFVLINIIVYYALFTSKIGRAWDAIGSSKKLASSIGVNVAKYRIANVLIGNFFLAIAGSYLVASTLVAIPTVFSFSNSVYIMMYVVVGGLAYSIAGPIIGAIIITFIPEYLRVAKEYEPIITSTAIILIIIFMPKGILGLILNKLKPLLIKSKWYIRFNKKS